MRVGGVELPTGIGVHSRSRLTYALGGAFEQFRTRVGLDDCTQKSLRRGSVIFRITGDEKTLWESAVIRTGEAAVTVPALSLAGVNRLTLEVDFADNFDIADCANWCEPILVRK